MRRTPAEEILGEWGVRDVTPPSQHERERLAADRELNALAGERLPRRIRRFRADPETYVASLGGPLPYMRRLRAIEEATQTHLDRLGEARAAAGGGEAWRRLAERWRFDEVNDLIDKHNRWYPIEARLPMDPRSRDFVAVGGRDYRLEPLDAGWILERFPA